MVYCLATHPLPPLKQMGRVRGGQAPLGKEGQVRLKPGPQRRGGGVGGAVVTSCRHSGAVTQERYESLA